MSNKRQRKDSLQGWAILGVLTLVSITLKITGVTPWSWLWVLAPLWLPLLVAIGLVACILLIVLFRVIWDALGGGIYGKD